MIILRQLLVAPTVVARRLVFLEVSEDTPVMRQVDGMSDSVLSDEAECPSVVHS
jgi:hypothetical protein